MNYFFVFPCDTSGTGRRLFFLPTGLAAGPGKEDAENTLSNELGRKIFRQQAQAVLDRTDRRQSNFAEKIDGLAEGVLGNGCREGKRVKQWYYKRYKSTEQQGRLMSKTKATYGSLCSW